MVLKKPAPVSANPGIPYRANSCKNISLQFFVVRSNITISLYSMSLYVLFFLSYTLNLLPCLSLLISSRIRFATILASSWILSSGSSFSSSKSAASAAPCSPALPVAAVGLCPTVVPSFCAPSILLCPTVVPSFCAPSIALCPTAAPCSPAPPVAVVGLCPTAAPSSCAPPVAVTFPGSSCGLVSII